MKREAYKAIQEWATYYVDYDRTAILDSAVFHEIVDLSITAIFDHDEATLKELDAVLWPIRTALSFERSNVLVQDIKHLALFVHVFLHKVQETQPDKDDSGKAL